MLLKRVSLLLIIILLFTACAKLPVAVEEKDELDIWYYIEPEDYSSIGPDAVDAMVSCAKANDIVVNVTCIDGNLISYDDYVLKRNMAMASGQLDILIDYPYNIYSLRNKCGDYAKLRTYDDILDNFKGGFCIPVAVRNFARILDGRAFAYYGIDTPRVICDDEYYALKQEMKKAGAKFEMNSLEMKELVDYYMKQNTAFSKEDGKFAVNKENIKSAIDALCNEIKENYENFSIEKAREGSAIYAIALQE